VRRRRIALLVFAAGSAAALLGFAGVGAAASTPTGALNPSSNEECFRCHGVAGQAATVTVEGRQKSIYVDRARYAASLHGKLACTSCHLGFKPGPHDAAQTTGWLATAKLTACGNCHADVFAAYRGSAHGHDASGQSSGRAPVCGDCHDAHYVQPTDTPAFRAGIDKLCARCHPHELETYLNSYHGKASYLGNAKTAVCTDCHGSHQILPPSDPASTVSSQNLVQTCSQCHPGANKNFAGFMVHVDPADPRSSFTVWLFYAAYIILIAVVFTFGAVHTTLYIYRGKKDGLYARRRSH
jgi:Cytochrome c7 and related cytochrome c